MKTSKLAYFVLLFAGIFLMVFFGVGIARSLKQVNSSTGDFLLPGYSIGLILISGSMFLGSTSRMRDIESKLQKLEKKATN